MDTIPFTYKLIFKPTGQYYYGVRYAKGCNPSDLWNTYFSSSDHIKTLINEYGFDSFTFKVMRIFDDSKKAISHEYKMLRRVNASQNGKFLNKTNCMCPPDNRGLIVIHHPLEDKQCFHHPELPLPEGWLKGVKASHKESMSRTRVGRPAVNKGKKCKSTGPCTEERKSNIQKARINTVKIKCGYCGKECDPGNYKQFHGESCKKNPNIDPNILLERSKKGKKSYNTQVEKGSWNNFNR